MKKFISLLLVLLLVVALFASCGKTEDPVEPEAPKTEDTDKTEEVADEPEESEDEPEEVESDIIWSGTISYAPYFFGPIEDDEVTPLIEEALLEYGYDVTIEPVYIENSEYTELLNVRIGAKDAPDMFICGSSARANELYEQGAIASWDKEFFIEHAPTIYSYVEKGGIDGRLSEYVDMFWELSSIDGEMVTIPSFSEEGIMIHKAVIYRGDWLEKLGVTEEGLPYTIEEFSDLMYRFKDEDPNDSGADDTYGYSTSMIGILFGAYGAWTGFPNGSANWHEVDGKMVNGAIMPENKAVLELLAQHYADKILDPEFVTGENEGGYWAISHAFLNGKIGVSAHASIDHFRLPEVMGDEGGPVTIEYYDVNGPDSTFVYGPFIAGPEGKSGYLTGHAAGLGEGNLYDARLNDDPEKLAAIFAIHDIFARDDNLAMLAHYGVEGVHYELGEVNNLEIAKRLAGNEELNAKGAMAHRTLAGNPYALNEKYINTSFYNDPSIANRLNIQSQEQYGGKYPSALYASTESTADYNQELITYRDETFIKIITGELGIDYWDTYVEEFMNRGGAILTEEAQEFWDARN